MVGYLALSDQILGAGDLIGKHRPDQVFGGHARELRRDLAAAAETRQRQRYPADPAPPRDEHRRIEHRLDEQRPDARRVEVARHVGKLETVRRGEREHDVVLGRRGLKLEIEFAAKALAQRQPPGAIDAAAVGRMDHQLHAAGFVEEALEHQDILGRQAAERGKPRRQVFDQLLGRGLGNADLLDEPAQCALSGGVRPEVRGDLGPQARHRERQFVAAARRLAQPERNGRRHAVGILDADDAALDAQDAVGLVAELKNVAG